MFIQADVAGRELRNAELSQLHAVANQTVDAARLQPRVHTGHALPTPVPNVGRAG